MTAARPMTLLSFSRMLIPVGLMWFYVESVSHQPAIFAVFVVATIYLILSSAMIVGWIETPLRIRDWLLLIEGIVIVFLNIYASYIDLRGPLPTMFAPLATTIYLQLPRRWWKAATVALLIGMAAGSGFAWVRYAFAEVMIELLLYAALIIFAGSVGMLTRILTDEKTHSMQLLQEVTDARASLERANKQLRETAAIEHSLAVLEERQRLARDIHDSVAHGLTALVVQTQAGRRLVQRGETDRALETIARCEEMARAALQDTRQAVRALHPSGLEQQTDVEALRRLARDFGAATGMAIDVQADAATSALPPDIERLDHLYRICQEALTNAHRHGEAKAAHLALRCADGHLTLHISNDGRAPDGLSPGVGLKSMGERVKVLGGTLTVAPAEQGVAITVTVPVATREATA